MNGQVNAAAAHPDWPGMLVCAAVIVVPGLIGWAWLAYGDRRRLRDMRRAREQAPDFGCLTDGERAEWERIEHWYGAGGPAARVADWGIGG